MFVVFEGVEGAGKSTQLELLTDRLRSAGVPHRVVREPGTTAIGERIRALVLDPAVDMCDETELLLIVAARAEFVRRVVRPALAAGELVLSDRYELSTLAYQGAGRGLGVEQARDWSRLATEGLTPDLTVLLTVPVDLGRGRLEGERDRLESETAEFHARVAEAYERLAAADERIVTVRTDTSPDDVHARIWTTLSTRWPERFPTIQAEPGNFSAASEFHEQGVARGAAQNDGEEDSV